MKSRAESGFTLLEVLVALGIAAVGLAAVSKSMVQNIEVVQRLEERMLATWVASNRLAELRMERKFVRSGDLQGQAEFAGHTWYLREKYKGTDDPELSRVDVSVFMEEGQSRPSATLFGYVSLYNKGKQ
ncbi:MAG: type II secretion system minor pseudopilin GspI [Pseudomonadota bacterium]|nr:type II secretion system minor pseudopilin GspI [Pseudomonadota bacterium]